MAKPEDKVLACRRCGKEFHFTGAEQEFYTQKGRTEPSHCPQCRSARRRRGLRPVCSRCGVLLEIEDSACCSDCVDNLKMGAELKHQEQQERIKELEGRLETLRELEQSLASVTMELEKTQQANRELKDRMAMPDEAASWDGLRGSLQRLDEQFGAFKESYACDIDKLTGLLLEVQYAVIQQRDTGLWHQMRMALTRKTRGHKEASAKTNNVNMPSAQVAPKAHPLPKNKDVI